MKQIHKQQDIVSIIFKIVQKIQSPLHSKDSTPSLYKLSELFRYDVFRAEKVKMRLVFKQG